MNETNTPRRNAPIVEHFLKMNFALLAVLIVLSVILLISVAGVKKSVKTDLAACESQLQMLSSEVASLRQSNQVLSDQISNASFSSSSSVQPAENTIPVYSPDDNSGGIEITWQPLSVETTLGRSDALLFSMKANATNSAVTFVWQKLNESTNVWETIKFEYPGYNDELGLRLYDNSVNGETQLWANGLTEAAFGIYRCVASDARNNQAISNTVSATVKVE